MKGLNLNLLIIVLVGLLIVGVFSHPGLKDIGGQLLASLTSITQKDSLENLTQCLTNEGVKLYGSSRDVDTQKQKTMLGKAVNSVPYVECVESESGQLTFECQVETIKTFPTWEFSNTKRVAGILSLEELKELSDCRF